MPPAFNDIPRLAFGFHNPNHAAAALCALLPLCRGGRRAWLGRILSGGLFTLLLLTRSRTGLLVAACEGAAWWWVSRRGAARAASAPYRCRGHLRGLSPASLGLRL